MAAATVCMREESEWRTYGENYNSSESTPRLNPCSFTLHKKLGRGMFGEVFLGSSAFGEFVALKKISKNNRLYNSQMVSREIRAGQILKNEKIVEFKSFF